MWSAELDEAQAGTKIAGRNINNLTYADDITLIAESEELKNLLMKLKRVNVSFTKEWKSLSCVQLFETPWTIQSM